MITYYSSLNNSNFLNVKAQYILNQDKSIQVINSGVINTVIVEINGTAITTEEDNLLKVSFFPNIYSDYKILRNYNFVGTKISKFST